MQEATAILVTSTVLHQQWRGSGFTEKHMCLIKTEVKNSNKYTGHCPVRKTKPNKTHTKIPQQQQKRNTNQVNGIYTGFVSKTQSKKSAFAVHSI